MSIHRFKYLFHQFVNKTATSEETEEFLRMMKRDDYNEEVQSLLDEFWKEPSSITPLGEERAERIFNQIMISSQKTEPVRTSQIYRNGWFWFKTAAAIFIVALSALLYQQESKPTDIRKAAIENKANKSEIPRRRFKNLPDGSSVILNENSKIDVAAGFNKNGKREVYLYGEAYFDVVHDARQPFIVHTGKLQTTVLGTAFNINASLSTGTVVVTVSRGKVKVGDSEQIFEVIDPDEQVVFEKDLTMHTKNPVKAKSITAWKNEDIYFDDVSIKDIANQLQERFNVSIIFSNEIIKNCRFSATFLKSQSLEQILNVISEFNQMKYHFKNDNIILLDGVGCK